MQKLPTHLTDEQLSALLDDRLDMSERVSAEEHVAACRDCASNLAQLRMAIQMLRTLPEPQLPRSFLITEAPAPSIWKRLLSWDLGLRSMAAAAAAMFVVLLSADVMAVSRSSGGVPFNPSLSAPAPQEVRTATKLAPTATLAAAPVPAAAPVITARRAEAPVPAQSDAASAPKAEATRAEPLTSREAVAGSAGSLASLSPLTLGAGLLAITLIVMAVTRSVRKV